MMDAARFLGGESLEEFVLRAEKYKELWTLGTRRAAVPADVLEMLSVVNEPIRLVALNEDWCLDAVGVLPYVAKLAEEHEHFEFRSLGRDSNLDLMDSHLTGTSRAIPVVIAYDADWRELGWWGPRPSALQAWAVGEGTLIPKPDRYHYLRQWYARDHGATSLREIAAMLLTGLASRSESAATSG